MDELSAINRILSIAGERSVTDINNLPNNAALARQFLQDTATDITTQGRYDFNYRENYVCHPEPALNLPDQYIVPMPANWAEAIIAPPYVARWFTTQERWCIFNIETDTYFYNQDVTITQLWETRDFNALAPKAQRYAVLVAARKYIDATMGRESSIGPTQGELLNAQRDMTDFHSMEPMTNLLTDNPQFTGSRR